MNCKHFITGMGMGIVAGSAIGMLVNPRNHRSGKSMVGRCLKSMGEVIDNVTDVLK